MRVPNPAPGCCLVLLTAVSGPTLLLGERGALGRGFGRPAPMSSSGPPPLDGRPGRVQWLAGWQAGGRAGEGTWGGALQFALVLGTVHPTLGPAQFILLFAVATLGVGLGVCARSNRRQEAPWTRVAHVPGCLHSGAPSLWGRASSSRGRVQPLLALARCRGCEGRGAERCSKLAQAGGPESWATLSLRVLGRGGCPAPGFERGAHR